MTNWPTDPRVEVVARFLHGGCWWDDESPRWDDDKARYIKEAEDLLRAIDEVAA